MRQKLLDLYEIQRIDVGIREIEKRLEHAPARLQELEGALGESTALLQKSNEQREAIVKEVKTIEASVQAEAQKLRKWESRLAEIRNQREYLALSREIEGSKRANREAEEKVSELNAQREQLDQQIEALHNSLAEIEFDLSAERAKVETTLASITTEVEQERARRQALLGKVPATLLRKYEKIRAKRLGIGLVPVVDGKCQGCNMRLPPQLYNILQRSETAEQCPSCQRLVFWGRLIEEAPKKGGQEDSS